MRLRRWLIVVAALAVVPLPVAASPGGAVDVTSTDNVNPVAHIAFPGGTEVDYDGRRYLYAGQANLTENLQRQDVEEGQHGGVKIIDLLGDGQTPPFSVAGTLDCPGTDNYVRYMDPAVFNTAAGDREFIVVAHHGNLCTQEALTDDPNTWPAFGAFNGIMIVDVTDKADPRIASAVGHRSAHTVMPHPTRPYLFILPGGIANGVTVDLDEPRVTISPTGIVDASDPHNPVYVNEFTHNVQGCHDLGFTPDGQYAYCAGIGEVQVWDIAGDRIANPRVVGSIINPAIQFAHNVVVSPDGRSIAINDEAFAFHTCTGGPADIFGALWIYDITVPEVPRLRGRIDPPGHPAGSTNVATPVDWTARWCTAHNYNWVPGTDIVVSSWFAGGVAAHDISDPANPRMLAHYMPHDGVAWSGHYYGGYIVTNDMVRGVEILDVPELRAAEAAGPQPAPVPDEQAGSVLPLPEGLPGLPGPEGLPGLPGLPQPPELPALPDPPDLGGDLTSLLIPAELPPRPLPVRDPQGPGVCVLPATPLRG